MTFRSRKLLNLANGAPCMHCGVENGTTVAAHANSQQYGKGMGHKASDAAIAFLCHLCHSRLDQGRDMSKQDRLEMWRAAAVKTYIWLMETGKLKVAA